jgi:hypothetical protein
MRKVEGENYLLVRRMGSIKKWHPGTDSAMGNVEGSKYTKGYGSYVASETVMGETHFGLDYSTIPWKKILFAYGDFSQWVIYTREVWTGISKEGFCSDYSGPTSYSACWKDYKSLKVKCGNECDNKVYLELYRGKDGKPFVCWDGKKGYNNYRQRIYA